MAQPFNHEDLAELPPEQQAELIDSLTEDQAEALFSSWEYQARHKQYEPEGDWRYWLLLAGRGFGKATRLDTPIPTVTHWKPMGELEIGDEVFDERGNPCHVTGIFEVPEPEVSYRLTFSDGSTIDACSEHRWVTWTHADRKAFLRSPYENTDCMPDDWVNWRLKRIAGGGYLTREVVDSALELQKQGLSVRKISEQLNISRNAITPHLKAGHYIEREPKVYDDSPDARVRTTQEIADTLTYSKRGDLNHCIPQTKPLNLPEADLPIPPYTLGLWLADGNSYHGSISKHPDDLPFLRSQVENEGFQTTQYSEPGTFGVLELSTKLKALNLVKNKHVPPIYLRASISQRLAFLQGLLDGDGYAGENGYCEFSNTNPSISNAVYELLVSLGMRATRAKKIPTLNGEAHTEVELLSFVPTMPVFRLPRKVNRLRFDRAQSFRRYHRMIEKVERIPSVPMRCITVDSPNHMYLAGEAMIPTHNTLTITQWGKMQARNMPESTGAVVAATASDLRDVLVEGDSGFLSTKVNDFDIPRYSPTLRRLTWANGSKAILVSADEPDRLRGLNSHWAICDEFAAWRRPAAFDMLKLGLRMGKNPRCAIATTPKPVKHLRDFLKDPAVEVTSGSTYENRHNLAKSFFDDIVSRYGSSRLGQQEILGIMLDDISGALWTAEMIEDGYVFDDESIPELTRVLVAVDPAVTVSEDSSETGIIVGGVSRNKHAYILEDLSFKGSPEAWARTAVDAYVFYGADAIVVEVNNGGDLVEHTIRTIDPDANVIKVRASRGKIARAEPIASLYEQRRVHHTQIFEALEKQQREYMQGQTSPDRLDALVWLIFALLLDTQEDELPYRIGKAVFGRRMANTALRRGF